MAGTERRIVLVGKTGNGKSSTGNSLLRRTGFKTGTSLTSITQNCQFGKCIINGMAYTIVDTPGLMDPKVKLGHSLLAVQHAVGLCPEPHAFLLIFSSSSRMTPDEIFTIDLLRVAFGEDVFDHCVIVFTNGNNFKGEEEFTQFWKESNLIVELVEKCGGRITKIENESSVDVEDNRNIHSIIRMIEDVSCNGRKMYRYELMEIQRSAISEHIHTYRGPGDLQQELDALVRLLGKRLDTDKWQPILIGLSLLTGAVAAVVFLARLVR